MEFVKPEILSPAGDFEKLTYAVLYGADAVYLGMAEFGMRASAGVFDPESLKKAADFVHSHGKKLYVTLNTIPHPEEMGKLPEVLEAVSDACVDAVIVSDIGVLSVIKDRLPGMEVHISTQAGVVNHIAAKSFYQMGAKRVVLARELTLDEIGYIRDNTPPGLELEVFVHGAMCVSFSGRCLLSSYLVNRDANRGECAQPCRWGYHLVEEKRPELQFPVMEDGKGTYILNAKDLCMLEHIDKLVKAGVSSFKIEGRAKSFYYNAVVTGAYRTALDMYYDDPANFKLPSWLVDEVQTVSHRQYSTGFFFGPPENGQYYENGGYVRTHDVVATVDGFDGGYLLVTARNKFCIGDTVWVVSPGKKPEPLIVGEILDSQGNKAEAAVHPMSRYKVKADKGFAKGAILRRKNTQAKERS